MHCDSKVMQQQKWRRFENYCWRGLWLLMRSFREPEVSGKRWLSRNKPHFTAIPLPPASSSDLSSSLPGLKMVRPRPELQLLCREQGWGGLALPEDASLLPCHSEFRPQGQESSRRRREGGEGIGRGRLWRARSTCDSHLSYTHLRFLCHLPFPFLGNRTAQLRSQKVCEVTETLCFVIKFSILLKISFSDSNLVYTVLRLDNFISLQLVTLCGLIFFIDMSDHKLQVEKSFYFCKATHSRFYTVWSSRCYHHRGCVLYVIPCWQQVRENHQKVRIAKPQLECVSFITNCSKKCSIEYLTW